MITKLITISFTTLVALHLAVTPAMASNGKSQYLENNGNKTEIVYDLVDEGDNAHPSGKDRSVEPGRSLTQGNAQSDPDDNGKGPDRTNGGDDKQPNGLGGVDKEDQDNNNGCGNDDDFEDDNEGWCGHKPKVEQPETPDCPGEPETPEEPEEPESPEQPEDPETPEVPTTPGVGTVLPTLTTLPNTGVDSQTTFSLVYLALGLVSSGAALHLVSKKYEELSQKA